MQVMKRMLNTPKMDRNKAASPNLALPSSSLNRTCQREEEVRRALDPPLWEQSGCAGASATRLGLTSRGRYSSLACQRRLMKLYRVLRTT